MIAIPQPNGSVRTNGHTDSAKIRHSASHPCPVCGGQEDERVETESGVSDSRSTAGAIAPAKNMQGTLNSMPEVLPTATSFKAHACAGRNTVRQSQR